MKSHFWITAAILAAGLLAPLARADENIALGKKYTLTPAPNGEDCLDDEDTIQLTDGETTQEYFWVQRGCVGWYGRPWVDITIDLEKEEPICSAAFTAAAGTAGVDWPLSASFFVSCDGEEWYFIGDLMMLDLEQNGARDASQYNKRTISASGLACKGRFAKIILHSNGYIFTDEIQIGRGDASLLQRPNPGLPRQDPQADAQRDDYLNFVRARYIIDAGNAADKILEMSQTAGSPQKEELAALAEEVRAVRADENFLSGLSIDTFRTVFPFDAVHAGIFAAVAKARRLADPGIAPLIVDRILPYDAPDIVTGAEPMPHRELFMASGEIKPLVYQILNTTTEPLSVSVRFGGKAAGLFQEVFSVSWTDTTQLVPLATALVPMQSDGGSYEMTVYPGIPSQVWIDVSAKKAEAGEYNGSIHFAAGTNTVDKSLLVRVSTVRLPEEQTLVLGGWDDSDFGGHGPVTPSIRDKFVSLIKKYGVNGPWATPGLVFQGIETDFSDPDHLKVIFDTEEAENWLKLWPDAKEYYIFLAARNSFCDWAYDTPQFRQLVADWAKKWGQWFESKGISLDRVSMLVHDEPGIDPNQDCRPIIAWSEAIHAGEALFRIWEDPVYMPVAATPKQLLEVCDTVCPKRTDWPLDRAGFEQIYRPLIAAGKRLDFYSCSGPVSLLDPYAYHRLQAWHLFREGGKGSFFWSFHDGTGTPWNTYRETRNGYAPVFIEPDNPEMIPAKQIAAMRESVYDFEILTMFRNRLEEAKSKGKDVEAEEQWLRDKIDSVIWEESLGNSFLWPKAKDRTGADRVREEILRRLEAMM
ncbi:MAG: hypothetical protein IJH68_10710 [Thermoguttaceae bacterium]|nr:hypothetical protein [Thermoguttaceae bacterium]